MISDPHLPLCCLLFSILHVESGQPVLYYNPTNPTKPTILPILPILQVGSGQPALRQPLHCGGDSLITKHSRRKQQRGCNRATACTGVCVYAYVFVPVCVCMCMWVCVKVCMWVWVRLCACKRECVHNLCVPLRLCEILCTTLQSFLTPTSAPH